MSYSTHTLYWHALSLLLEHGCQRIKALQLMRSYHSVSCSSNTINTMHDTRSQEQYKAADFVLLPL
jgi:hypothetical protein